MRPPNEGGPSAERPLNTGTGYDAERHSSVRDAVDVLGQVINTAFSDALRLDHLARLIVDALDGIGFDQRIELGDQYPRLTEGLILLEDSLDRMDRR